MEIHATTILAFRYKDHLVMAGDGQVTVGNAIIMKHGASKIRRLQDGKVIAGFAGSAADGMTLFQRFEEKLKTCNGQLSRAAVELARDWRNDKYLRKLEAMIVVGDLTGLFIISGAGDVMQPDDNVVGIGSGGPYAQAAARALIKAGREDLSASEIAKLAMHIAAEICPFTNTHLTIEEL
jgi:ATP-dependent HslUV protease subunit HslV